MVNVLPHCFCLCLQMHDIVKAVGNCSYNQLVEKIISCKQSDNSELAGEGECFLLICSSFWPAQLPCCLPSPLLSVLPVHLEVQKRDILMHFGEKFSDRNLKFKRFNWEKPSLLNFRSEESSSSLFVFAKSAALKKPSCQSGLSSANIFWTKPQSMFKWNQDTHVTYFHSSQFSYQLSVTSLNIWLFSTELPVLLSAGLLPSRGLGLWGFYCVSAFVTSL